MLERYTFDSTNYSTNYFYYVCVDVVNYCGIVLVNFLWNTRINLSAHKVSNKNILRLERKETKKCLVLKLEY